MGCVSRKSPTRIGAPCHSRNADGLTRRDSGDRRKNFRSDSPVKREVHSLLRAALNPLVMSNVTEGAGGSSQRATSGLKNRRRTACQYVSRKNSAFTMPSGERSLRLRIRHNRLFETSLSCDHMNTRVST